MYRRKLKPERSITGYIPVLVALFVALLAGVFFGRVMGFRVAGFIILAYSLITLIPLLRTRNIGYLASMLYMLSLALFLLSIPESELRGNMRWHLPEISIFLVVTTIFLLIWLLYLAFRKKTKWRGRELLELAAMNITESPESFTPRPRPIAKLQFTKPELRDFAGFLERNLISLVFIEDNGLVCMPVRVGEEIPLLYKFNIDYADRTWVRFQFDGNVTARISKKDYLYYKDDLSFDNLCNSLGQLYLEFFELFRQGKEIRIIDRMDELRISVFS